MAKNDKFSAVILAAGLSERMGTPKLLLEWKGKTFIENIVQGYRENGVSEIIIVTNDKDAVSCNGLFSKDTYGLKTVINKHPEKGRFLSLKIALSALKNKNMCFVHNVDNPFTEKKVITEMMKTARAGSYVVPVFKTKKGHPIMLAESIIEGIIETSENECNLKFFLKKYACVYCQCTTSKILVNINTLEDYKNTLLTDDLCG